MSATADYRTLSRIDLRRSFTSLGVPRAAFVAPAGGGAPRRMFDAVLNADASTPDALWLFKGADYYTFDLSSGAIVEGPLPIADGPWGAGNLPLLFRTGIHSALWAGPAFPHLWSLFKDEMFVSMDTNQGWTVTEGPRGVLGSWGSGVWTEPDGTWATPGAPVALHGLGAGLHGKAHFFKDGQYVRHDFFTGQAAIGPVPVAEEWALPERFSARIDLAFYGAGPDEENIFFVCDEEYVLYDFRLGQVLASGLVEERFPAFGQFIGRPQLFLVEDYSMETLIGPPHLGRLVDTRSIGAGSSITRVLVTQTSDMSRTGLTQSLLSSQDSTVVEDFYNKVDEHTRSSRNFDQYRHQLDGYSMSEDVEPLLWGGETESLRKSGEAGETTSDRHAMSEVMFSSIATQVEDTRRQVEQRTYNSETDVSTAVNVLKQEIFQETNESDHVRVYEFYEQLQPFITLLLLRRVRVAYSDGSAPVEVVQLPALVRLLDDVLVEPSDRKQLIAFLRRELTAFAVDDDSTLSVLAGEGDTLAMRSQMTTAYPVARPDGTTQTLTVPGVLVGQRSWVEPTFTITCVQV